MQVTWSNGPCAHIIDTISSIATRTIDRNMHPGAHISLLPTNQSIQTRFVDQNYHLILGRSVGDLFSNAKIIYITPAIYPLTLPAQSSPFKALNLFQLCSNQHLVNRKPQAPRHLSLRSFILTHPLRILQLLYSQVLPTTESLLPRILYLLT